MRTPTAYEILCHDNTQISVKLTKKLSVITQTDQNQGFITLQSYDQIPTDTCSKNRMTRGRSQTKDCPWVLQLNISYRNC